MNDKQFDLNIGNWGPYNKKYLGLCNIADAERGISLNVELFPGFFRRNVLVSRAVNDGGLKMWGANADLTRFIYRYELEWKDRVYLDADFTISGENRCDIACTFVNNTEIQQSVNLNFCAYLRYPEISCETGKKYQTVFKPLNLERAVFIDAVDYSDICCAETLASDGRYLGEEKIDFATNKGSAISEKYFYSDAHFLKYNIKNVSANSIGIRYKCSEKAVVNVVLNGTYSFNIELDSTTNFDYKVIKFDNISVNDLTIKPKNSAVTLDGFVVGIDVENVKFEPILNCNMPIKTIGENFMVLKYTDVNAEYKIEWDLPAQLIRRFICDDIGVELQQTIHNHVSTLLDFGGDNVVDNVLTEPLYLKPGERKTINFKITKNNVNNEYKESEIYKVNGNSDGQKFEFSQNLMAYTTLLNVVYPIYTRRQYIRHNTPGRNWDSLYTWDSGFIGMGLATIDFNRAFDCLNTYLTPVNDIHSPFIFHGSVVPTQIFLYKYLYDNYTENRDKLKSLYPMVKQYFNFYANLIDDSNQMKSGLLKTFHIFYNSGGWDDYPPQLYIQNATGNKNAYATYDNTTPVITTAITVLIAKILKQLSLDFGYDDNVLYDAVIKRYSKPILDLLWDDSCGYFSYMVHNENGLPKAFLTAEDGSNFNQGFDGIYPYIAGITNERQNLIIKDNIVNGLMTEIGVGAVDKRASYYSKHGYWNGSVWMPHQWILFNSLLDNCEYELAESIINKALSVWKNEVDETYCCFENFMSENGRGSGFHQFSGLSTPVLMFYKALYIKGSVTVGFMSTVVDKSFNSDYTNVELTVNVSNEKSIIVICMNSKLNYTFTVDGEEIKCKRLSNGAYGITVPGGKHTILSKIIK